MNMFELQEWCENEAPAYAWECQRLYPGLEARLIEPVARGVCEKLGRNEQVLQTALAAHMARMLGHDDIADGWETVYMNELREIYEKETH